MMQFADVYVFALGAIIVFLPLGLALHYFFRRERDGEIEGRVRLVSESPTSADDNKGPHMDFSRERRLLLTDQFEADRTSMKEFGAVDALAALKVSLKASNKAVDMRLPKRVKRMF